MPFLKSNRQAVTESDNKAAYCHTPVLQRHRPFRGTMPVLPDTPLFSPARLSETLTLF